MRAVRFAEIAREAGLRLHETGAIRTDLGQRTDHPDIFAIAVNLLHAPEREGIVITAGNKDRVIFT